VYFVPLLPHPVINNRFSTAHINRPTFAMNHVTQQPSPFTIALP
jgi:hypothetical protein